MIHSLCVDLQYTSCFIPPFWPLDILAPRILKNVCNSDVRREVLRQYVPYCGLLSNDTLCLVTNHQTTVWCNSRNTGTWTDYRTSILYVTGMAFLYRIHKICALWETVFVIMFVHLGINFARVVRMFRLYLVWGKICALKLMQWNYVCFVEYENTWRWKGVLSDWVYM